MAMKSESTEFSGSNDRRRQSSIKPTLYIGLGGFGCGVLRMLKTRISEMSLERTSAFAFIGIDTQNPDPDDVLTRNEYIPLSLGVNPKTAANQEPEYLGWFPKIVRNFPVKSIRSGANLVKAVGRLAYRNPATFEVFVEKLKRALNDLGLSKESLGHDAPIKVFVVTTIAGGTGAGCALDVLAVIGSFFRERIGPDFPYRAILVTPDVLEGEATEGNMPFMYANAYSTIKEILSTFAQSSDLIVSFNNREFKNVKICPEVMPTVLHLIGDKNENGKPIVRTIEELGHIVVSYLLSDIQNPLRDRFSTVNMDEHENPSFLMDGRDGTKRAFSSFGVVRTGLPIEVVEDLFSLRLMRASLQAELCVSDAYDRAIAWVNEHKLQEKGANQLQDRIRSGQKDVTIDAKGSLMAKGFRYEKLPAECRNYEKKTTATLKQDVEQKIIKAVDDIAKQACGNLASDFLEEMKQSSLGNAVEFLDKVEMELRGHQSALKEETSQSLENLAKLDVLLNKSIQNVEQAVKGWYGRRRRIEDTIGDFDTRFENRLNKQIEAWIRQHGDNVYVAVIDCCLRLRKKWDSSAKMLSGHLSSAEQGLGEVRRRLDQLADIERRGPENRFSLVDSNKVDLLFSEMVEPGMADCLVRIRRKLLDERLIEMTEKNFERWFAPIRDYLLNKELPEKLRQLDFIRIVQRFYGEEGEKKLLFQKLHNLSVPLFHLDPNKRETSYDSYWIVGVDSSLKSEFHQNYDRFLPAQGKVYTSYVSPFEVILFQLKFGYTISSYLPLRMYAADYKRLYDAYRASETKNARPVNCWIEAEDWRDLLPNPEAEEALKWFILGRALSYLFPSTGAASPTDRKNTAFLYNRGAYYYLQTAAEKKPELLGKSLASAVSFLTERLDLQGVLQKMVRAKIAEIGEQMIGMRLDNEYVPILREEMRIASENYDSRESERAEVLRKLLAALQTFIGEELKTARI